MKQVVVLNGALTDVYMDELKRHVHPGRPPLPIEGEVGFFDIVTEAIEAVRGGSVEALIDIAGLQPTIKDSLAYLASVTDRTLLDADRVEYKTFADVYIAMLFNETDPQTTLDDVKTVVRDYIECGGVPKDIVAAVNEVEEEKWHGK